MLHERQQVFGAYEYEWYQGQYAASFTDATNRDSAHSRFEDELELTEEHCGDSTDWLRQYATVKDILEVTNDAGALAISKAVTYKIPLYGTDTYDIDRRYEARKAALPS